MCTDHLSSQMFDRTTPTVMIQRVLDLGDRVSLGLSISGVDTRQRSF